MFRTRAAGFFRLLLFAGLPAIGTLIPVTGDASTGPAGRTRQLVPIVLDVPAGAARYTAELDLLNQGSLAARVTLTYTASLGAREGSGTVSESLEAGEQLQIPDVISYLRSKGLPIAEAGPDSPQGGTLLVEQQDGSTLLSDILATARITSETSPSLPAGRSAMSVPVVALPGEPAQRLTVFGLRSDDTERSNVAVYNTGSEPVTVRVTASSGAGDGREAVVADDLTLPAYGWLQINRVLGRVGIANGYVTVTRTSPGGSMGAYGVVNDNVTNDGSYIPASAPAGTGSRWTLPVLVETPSFQSELILANRTREDAFFTLAYRESLTPQLGAGGTAVFAVPAGQQRIIRRALENLRASGVAVGSQGTTSLAGAASVTVSGTSSGDVFVGARLLALAPGGAQFGFFVPGIPGGTEASEEAIIPGLRADAESRTNVAIVHAGPEGSGPVALRLQAFDGSGTGEPRGSSLVVSLGPGEWAQPARFFAASGVENGYVRVTRLSGSAPWIAYGVVNDGGRPGERTGDGSWIPALSMPTPVLVPSGLWGGSGAALEVGEFESRLELDCAHGLITRPLALDQNGTFEVDGIYVRERPGPVPVEPPTAYKGDPATYKGVVTGDIMELTITARNPKDLEIGTFKLIRGAAPRINKCL